MLNREKIQDVILGPIESIPSVLLSTETKRRCKWTDEEEIFGITICQLYEKGVLDTIFEGISLIDCFSIAFNGDAMRTQYAYKKKIPNKGNKYKHLSRDISDYDSIMKQSQADMLSSREIWYNVLNFENPTSSGTAASIKAASQSAGCKEIECADKKKNDKKYHQANSTKRSRSGVDIERQNGTINEENAKPSIKKAKQIGTNKAIIKPLVLDATYINDNPSFETLSASSLLSKVGDWATVDDGMSGFLNSALIIPQENLNMWETCNSELDEYENSSNEALKVFLDINSEINSTNSDVSFLRACTKELYSLKGYRSTSRSYSKCCETSPTELNLSCSTSMTEPQINFKDITTNLEGENLAELEANNTQCTGYTDNNSNNDRQGCSGDNLIYYYYMGFNFSTQTNCDCADSHSIVCKKINMLKH